MFHHVQGEAQQGVEAETRASKTIANTHAVSHSIVAGIVWSRRPRVGIETSPESPVTRRRSIGPTSSSEACASFRMRSRE